MTSVEGKRQVFEFSGGRLCLDFANTRYGRASVQPKEFLHGYADFVAWGEQAGVITREEMERFSQVEIRHPEEASSALKHAKVVREAIHRIFSGVAEELAQNEADLDILNAELALAMSESRIIETGNGFDWGWAGSKKTPREMLRPVVRSAADLLTSDDLYRVRECANEDCGWLFMDTSKNKSRRWCEMKTCGNRAKARKHYHRKRDKASAA
jgi:predicted RNA-binding Zn ribbon-like protein